MTTLQHELISYELQTQDSRPCTKADVDTFHPFQQQIVKQKAVGGSHVYAGDQVIDMVRSVWILGKIQITIILQPSLQ